MSQIKQPSALKQLEMSISFRKLKKLFVAPSQEDRQPKLVEPFLNYYFHIIKGKLKTIHLLPLHQSSIQATYYHQCMHIFPSNYLTNSISTQNLHRKVFLMYESEAQNKNERHKIVSHRPTKNEQAFYFKKKLLVRSDRRGIR